MMRMLATLIVSWGLIGVPALCQGGILVECCEDACPGESEPSEPCQCSSCLELCNAAVSHTEQSSGSNIERNVSPMDAAIPPVMIWRENVREGSTAWLAYLIREHLPYPVPDRPLLV